jgi:predicted hydrocarbon binding protein
MDKKHQANRTNESLSELSKLKNNEGVNILKSCGEECCKESKLYEAARNIRNQYPDEKDNKKLFNAFKQQYYNTSGLVKNGDKITLVFDKCTCALVEAGVSNPYLCHCTTGYSKTIFETLFEKEVRVDLEKSILRGDKVCRQIIEIMD